MLKTSSIFALLSLAALGTLAACAPAKSTSQYHAPTEPVISKDTKTQPTMLTQDDEILVAINEIGWARQSAALAINPPNVSAQEGCVIRRPYKNSNSFLGETYDCTRASDASDSQAGLKYELNGSQIFRGIPGLDLIQGSFSSRIWAASVLVAQGRLTRDVQISLPTGATGSTSVSDTDLQSSVFKMSSKTDYKGDVAQQSNHDGETWTSNLSAGFSLSSSSPLKLITGAQVTLSYLSEADHGTKRSPQVVQLTATSDVSFVESGVNGANCLRPVGTFALSNGSTQVGTLTATVDGYQVSTDKNTLHVWGLRCLER